MKQGFFFAGEGRVVQFRWGRLCMSHVWEHRAGCQPLRVLPQNTGEGKEVLQFDVFAEALLPLIDRGSRDAQRLGDVRLR